MGVMDIVNSIEKEVQGKGILMAFAKFKEIKIIPMDTGFWVKDLQKKVGDAVGQDSDGRIITIDWKVEEANKWGNFFLETWSNRKFEYSKPGWFLDLKAEQIWYYFLESDELYIIDNKSIWNWAFVDGNIYNYQEKPQSKYLQKNLTFGRCVPIEDILKSNVKCWPFRPIEDMNASGFNLLQSVA